MNEQGPGQNRGLVYYWVVPSLKGGRAVSRAFVKESEDQQDYLEWQKLLRDREELLRILEKKKKYLLEDPAAVKIPAEKRKEMLDESRTP